MRWSLRRAATVWIGKYRTATYVKRLESPTALGDAEKWVIRPAVDERRP
jgi:hypothetical protein